MTTAEGRLRRTLYVGGLDEQVGKDILEAAFIPFGEIRTVELPTDRSTGKHRGFGFVEFEEEIDAEHAIKNMHDSEIYGRTITVNLARSPPKGVGEANRPAWANDEFLRKRLEDQGLFMGEGEMDALVEANDPGENLA
eukprot:GHVO01068144.1.p4 GENE.GHVO01068144.1~~GHVO01068144.1.p4  ORF type:complete len:138 (+),score=24.73 GHVO01068144.1:522-935(+)